ncbi:hypothetical protein B0J13DRAFT_24398 [Dactylonectria estremocensis]|uniref:Nudix hydrolase domain-containing protein n=1 Tax=Dactylonectria estremocensis TaxID=1079267 RepID=A0A9P9FL49_9HYPO|nr:hypothetical protein B0J13DRAFT_24398 [Dactylonectria estremocensis]
MASTKLDQVWVQTSPNPRTSRPLSCSGALLPLPLPIFPAPRVFAMPPSLYCVIREGNKADKLPPRSLWEFRIAGVDEALGYLRDSVRREMLWDGTGFAVDTERRAVVLTPEVRRGEQPADACRRAFADLCLKNRGRLNSCFDKWLGRPADSREFHPIHVTDAAWQNLTIPLPARGVFGIITVGVHMNMYSVLHVDGRELVDRIWVSHRARGEDVCYAGMMDQVVAGGMDPTDKMDGFLAPAVTLKREAEEEAGLILDLDTKNVFSSSCCSCCCGQSRSIVGTVEEAPAIAFYDCKGREAGRGNEGHLEPGVRFVYDLKLEDAAFQPRSRERGIEKFEALTVDEVKCCLRDRRWKPNCGLVMLDFLVRKNLIAVADEERFRDIAADLRRSLPFKFAQEGFPFLAPWE